MLYVFKLNILKAAKSGKCCYCPGEEKIIKWPRFGSHLPMFWTEFCEVCEHKTPTHHILFKKKKIKGRGEESRKHLKRTCFPFPRSTLRKMNFEVRETSGE